MDSNSDPPSTDKGTAFSKPSKDIVNRNYRRRPPVSGSSSSDGSPEHNNSSSPKPSRRDHGKVSERQPDTKDGGKELNRDSERSYGGRSSDSYRNSDRQSRNSKGRESRGSTHFDHVRSREHSRYVDKNSQDKDSGSKFLDYQKYKDDSSSERLGSGRSVGRFEDVERERDRHRADRNCRDERRDYGGISRDFRSKRNFSYEESRGHRSDSIPRRDDTKHRESEGYKSNMKDMDDEKLVRDQRKKYDDTETKRGKDQITMEPPESFENKDMCWSEDQEFASKRPKFFDLDKGIAGRKVSKFTTTSDGRESSSSEQIQDGKMENDIAAAKVAAIKAAELVNRNLAGAGPAGCMTADQKKKLLWGNKKNATAEEVGHRWDTALFPDQERQEKFKKLMGVKGEPKLEHNPGNKEGTDLLRAVKQRELQQDLERQYTAGLRRRDGRTVGLGL